MLVSFPGSGYGLVDGRICPVLSYGLGDLMPYGL